MLYGQSIRYFCAWLAVHRQPTDLSASTRTNVLGWLESLRQRGLNDGTIVTRWRGLRRFTNWLLSEQIILKDPLAGIALVGACKGRAFNDMRDAAMIRLLVDCGLRVSELTGIDLKHLDVDAQTVQVTGKGARVRLAYFGSRTALALGRCLRARHRHRYASDEALLLGEIA